MVYKSPSLQPFAFAWAQISSGVTFGAWLTILECRTGRERGHPSLKWYTHFADPRRPLHFAFLEFRDKELLLGVEERSPSSGLWASLTWGITHRLGKAALRVGKNWPKLALARTPKLPSPIHVFKRIGGNWKKRESNLTRVIVSRKNLFSSIYSQGKCWCCDVVWGAKIGQFFPTRREQHVRVSWTGSVCTLERSVAKTPSKRSALIVLPGIATPSKRNALTNCMRSELTVPSNEPDLKSLCF